MAKIILEGVFEYDAEGMYGNDAEGLEWFITEILEGDGLQLWDHAEIGDSLGSFKVTRITDAPERA